MDKILSSIQKVDFRKLMLTFALAIVGIIFLLPFLWMISASLKREVDVMNYPIQWIPDHWNAAKNYSEVLFGDKSILPYYWNTLKVTILTTLTSLSASCLAGYSFAKLKFKGSNLLFVIVLITYMVPPQALVVTQYQVLSSLGLIDSHLGLIMLNGFTAFGTFMLRQFFMGIDDELMEAAKIDGAGYFRTFWSVGLPLVRPALATYAILRFIWTWNDYQYPLIFLRSDSQYTLQLGIDKFADSIGTSYALMMTGSVVAIVPLFIIFIIGQKQVIEGLTIGGVKG